MIVQIYEIQTPHEAETCISLGVDHIGSVILSLHEWRIPLLRETVRLSEGTDAKSTLIPLFHDRDMTYRAIDYYRPDYVHFCDSLTDEDGRITDSDKFIQFQSALKKRFPEVGIIRSIPIPKKGGPEDFPALEIAAALQSLSDIFLTDTWLGKEPVEGYLGITGQTVDWDLAGSLVRQSRIPVLLAGGLSPDNVYDGVMKVRPAGADSCTGTNLVAEEKSPIRFKKDFQKVERFVEEVRRAQGVLGEERDKYVARLDRLKGELKEREAALPAHSVRPHQIQAIEALEDDIESVEKDLERYRTV